MGSNTKRYYFFGLLIPVVFSVFFILNKNSAVVPIENTFCTTVKASRTVNVTLYSGTISLTSFDGANNSYSLVNYVGSIESPDSFRLQIKGAEANDTISFMAVNFFLKGHLYTLPKSQFSSLKTSPNVSINNSSPNLSLIVNNGGDIWVNISNPAKWENDNIVVFKWAIISLIFVLAIIALLIIKPAANHFYLATGISVIAMAFFWWIGQDSVSQIKTGNSEPIYSLYFYYNNIPSFSSNNQLIYDGANINKAAQINIDKYPFIRVGFAERTKKIDDLSFKITDGIFSKSWLLKDLSPNIMTGNDINYNEKTASYSINGSDPYLSLTSVYLYSAISKIAFLRSLAFLIITLLLFNSILIGLSFFTGLETSHVILIISFIVILYSGLVYLPFNSYRMIMDVEKRNSTRLPVLGKGSLVAFAKTLDQFINDQMPGRIQLISLNNYFTHKLFGGVPSQNPYINFGKDGWLFYVGNFVGDNAREIYENKHPLTDEELKKMRKVLLERRDWLKKQHIEYYLIMPRMPQFIYPEEIGPGLQVYNSPSKYTQLMDYLKETTDLNIIDVFTPLLAAKHKYKRDLFYRVDSHWNPFGAYFVYTTIIDTIRKKFPQIPPTIPLDSIKWDESYTTEGDEAKLVSLNKVMKRHEYWPINKRVNAYKQLPTPDYDKCDCVGPTYVYESYDSTLPRILMFRDSYSLFFAPYLSSHFSRQVYVWTQLFMPEIIEKEKPDIVVSEIVDRFIYSLLTPNPPLPAIDSTIMSVTKPITKFKNK